MTLQPSIPDWFVVGLGHDLKTESVLPGFAGDTEMAIWRDSASAVHAFNVRCPHRGMRLSYGFVREDRLACAYHGWQYAADGHCAYIPAHPELPPSRSICASVYPCLERYGLIWSRKDEIAHTETLMPIVKELDDIHCQPVRSYVVNRDCQSVATTLATGRLCNAATVLHPFVVTVDAIDSLLIDNTSDLDVIIGLQDINGHKTAMHLMLKHASASGSYNNTVVKSAARWGAQLRARLETTIEEGVR